uniref:ABC transporter domain-containing protein n=1 Tax=Macrostomum lignano TaxID=282301 RepID=A0A1I8JP43_9PLAT
SLGSWWVRIRQLPTRRPLAAAAAVVGGGVGLGCYVASSDWLSASASLFSLGGGVVRAETAPPAELARTGDEDASAVSRSVDDDVGKFSWRLLGSLLLPDLHLLLAGVVASVARSLNVQIPVGISQVVDSGDAPAGRRLGQLKTVMGPALRLLGVHAAQCENVERRHIRLHLTCSAALAKIWPARLRRRLMATLLTQDRGFFDRQPLRANCSGRLSGDVQSEVDLRRSNNPAAILVAMSPQTVGIFSAVILVVCLSLGLGSMARASEASEPPRNKLPPTRTANALGRHGCRPCLATQSRRHSRRSSIPLLEQSALHRNDPLRSLSGPADRMAPLYRPGQDPVWLKNVRFAYPGAADAVVLDGVSLTVPAAVLLWAVCGRSGAWQSTVTQLLTQNIRYGRPEATDAEVEAAARLAQAHKFIKAFPRGYDTHVGERGLAVSGGQKQADRHCQALLKDPKLLVDPPTASVDPPLPSILRFWTRPSALDSESERLVQAALQQAMQGRTVIQGKRSDLSSGHYWAMLNLPKRDNVDANKTVPPPSQPALEFHVRRPVYNYADFNNAYGEALLGHAPFSSTFDRVR